ncbi:DNA damage-binding protein 1, partial [Coemansia aciculifera]
AARFSVLAGGGSGEPGRVLDSLLLRPFEMPESLCVASDDGLFVLGTSVVLPSEDDAKQGRVLALRWDAVAGRIVPAGSFAALGAVYALLPFRRRLLLAAIGCRLLLLELPEDGGGEIAVLCSQQTQIAALSLAVHGDYIVVGDVMASAAVFQYRETPYSLVPVARDYAGVWTTAVAAVPPPLSDQTSSLSCCDEEMPAINVSLAQALRDPASERFVVSDAFDNIARMALSSTEQRLFVEGRWHVSDQINVIRSGSLAMDVADPEFPNVFRATHVYGTVQGSVGVLASVEDPRIGRILDRLQVNMAHLLPSPGMWDYDEWRAYKSDQRRSRAFGFLDGDLIERFLDLPHELQMLVVSGGGVDAGVERRRKTEYWAGHARVEAEGEVVVLKQMAVSDIPAREQGVTLEYVVRLVECLTRLH